jgi:xanthine dehydrogenase accessory factor
MRRIDERREPGPMSVKRAGQGGNGRGPLALIKGAGDLASGVAYRLRGAGYTVVMTEIRQPTAVRRTVAFAEAVYEGRVTVEGIEAAAADDDDAIADLLAAGVIPVVVDPKAEIRGRLRPDLLVDAIMAKRNLGTSWFDAPVVVALGPGFYAGRDAHAVVETMRGPSLGQVITHGEAIPDTGRPAERRGYSEQRLLRSPSQGWFQPRRRIGDGVTAGEVVGMVDDLPVLAQVDGIIRGLLREGLWVARGLKLGDVDPTATAADCYRISDKALAIGDGVLRAASSGLAYSVWGPCASVLPPT